MADMKIDLHLTAVSIPDLEAQLQALLGARAAVAVAPPAVEERFVEPPAVTPAPAAVEEPAAAPARRRRRAEAAAPEPAVAEETAAEPADAPVEERDTEALVEGAEAAAPVLDFEGVRTLLTQVQSQHRLAGVVTLLAETTGQRKLSDVDPADYPAVVAGAQRLLAQAAAQ